jgi:hypothetical protein
MKQQGATTINWGEAIEELRKGNHVRRIGWNGKGMFLFLFSQSPFCIKQSDYILDFPLDDESESTIHHIGFEFNNEFLQIADFILLKTAGERCIPWNASQEDQLAWDWEVI